MVRAPALRLNRSPRLGRALLAALLWLRLGLVRKNGNAARKGQMAGARYIGLGTVSSYDSNVESKASGSSFGLPGFGNQNKQLETKDYVAIDIRVVDSTSGEVIGSRTVEGRASNTAEAKAIRAALIDASSYVSGLLAPQGNCMARFDAQEQQRRERSRGVLQLE